VSAVSGTRYEQTLIIKKKKKKKKKKELWQRSWHPEFLKIKHKRYGNVYQLGDPAPLTNYLNFLLRFFHKKKKKAFETLAFRDVFCICSFLSLLLY